MSGAFDNWTKKELIKFLEGTLKCNSKMMTWLYRNHKKVLRQYEDEHLGGMRLELLDSKPKGCGKEIRALGDIMCKEKYKFLPQNLVGDVCREFIKEMERLE